MTDQPPPGWYRCGNETGERWWDGGSWTEFRRPAHSETHTSPASETRYQDRPTTTSTSVGVGARIKIGLLNYLPAVSIAGLIISGLAINAESTWAQNAAESDYVDNPDYSWNTPEVQHHVHWQHFWQAIFVACLVALAVHWYKRRYAVCPRCLHRVRRKATVCTHCGEVPERLRHL